MIDALHRTLATARDRLGVPALGAALFGPEGPAEVAVVGVGRRHSTEAVTAEDHWHIGSCGKSITAALYARMVELGRADWGVPVPVLFPDLGSRIDSGWSAATIDDLLLCRAGLPANLSRPVLVAAYGDQRPLPDQRTQITADALSRPPHHRGQFRYSNLGYIVAGAAIERIAGTPFEEALLAHLLEPLGIGAAGFGPPPTIWGHGPRLQVGGLCLGRGKPVAPEAPHGDNPPVMSPAGRLHLTLADWARTIQPVLADGAPLLTPATIDRLLHVPDDAKPTMAMGWAPAQFPGVELGMQGSNTMWVATALIADDRTRASLVVTNDGRTRNLARTAKLAATLLTDHC